MHSVPSIKLNSGYGLPLIGLGTFGGNDAPDQVYHASKHALEYGYKHFDTAYMYQTEQVLGKAIRESNIDRKELFITTKLWRNFNEPHHVRPMFNRSLQNLGMDYVDLYLIHWPISFDFHGYEPENLDKGDCVSLKQVPHIDTWREMERLVKDGVARSIGVSNFTIPMLEKLLSECEIPPAVNQVELHPCLPQQDLLDYCKSKNIALTAYSPLGSPGFRRDTIKTVDEQLIKDIGLKYDKTPVQVLINWGVNRGYSVIPKSVTASRIQDNLIYFKMDEQDIQAITELGLKTPLRTCDPMVLWKDKVDVFGTS
ncbi:Aldo/keto reductase [Backusella circina FSU 941]|nr:Aldo/keto reductase [Backusella circina FSU 941]